MMRITPIPTVRLTRSPDSFGVPPVKRVATVSAFLRAFFRRKRPPVIHETIDRSYQLVCLTDGCRCRL